MKDEEVPLRQMLREHIEQTKDFQLDVAKSLATIETHGTYTKKSIEDHTIQIDKLEGAHNRQKGALWAATTLGFMALVKLIKDIFS